MSGQKGKQRNKERKNQKQKEEIKKSRQWTLMLNWNKQTYCSNPAWNRVQHCELFGDSDLQGNVPEQRVLWV